jgi:hypothetical protein
MYGIEPELLDRAQRSLEVALVLSPFHGCNCTPVGHRLHADRRRGQRSG